LVLVALAVQALVLLVRQVVIRFLVQSLLPAEVLAEVVFQQVMAVLVVLVVAVAVTLLVRHGQVVQETRQALLHHKETMAVMVLTVRTHLVVAVVVQVVLEELQQAISEVLLVLVQQTASLVQA
jgi:hypothetical protein